MPGLPSCCIAKPLAAKQFDRAFPLVQLLAPKLTLERWRDYASAMTGTASASPGREGIIVLEDAAGYLFGLLSYADGLDLLHGPTLHVDNLVIPHLVACSEATGLMERAMQDISRRLDCGAIHIRLARSLGNEPKSGLARRLESSGYRAEGPTWCRVLPKTATNRP